MGDALSAAPTSLSKTPGAASRGFFLPVSPLFIEDTVTDIRQVSGHQRKEKRTTFIVRLRIPINSEYQTNLRLPATESLRIRQKFRGEVTPSPVGVEMVKAMYASPSSGPSPWFE